MMNEARETLKKYNVEIDVTDHRSPEEIVKALGLTAVSTETNLPSVDIQDTIEDKIARRPYFVK
jgi:hypothetical protein